MPKILYSIQRTQTSKCCQAKALADIEGTTADSVFLVQDPRSVTFVLRQGANLLRAPLQPGSHTTRAHEITAWTGFAAQPLHAHRDSEAVLVPAHKLAVACTHIQGLAGTGSQASAVAASQARPHLSSQDGSLRSTCPGSAPGSSRRSSFTTSTMPSASRNLPCRLGCGVQDTYLPEWGVPFFAPSSPSPHPPHPKRLCMACTVRVSSRRNVQNMYHKPSLLLVTRRCLRIR